jgi:hypothetical protein
MGFLAIKKAANERRVLRTKPTAKPSVQEPVECRNDRPGQRSCDESAGQCRNPWCPWL